MTRRPPTPPGDQRFDAEEESPEARRPATGSVISADGAFRLLLILLTIWTFFEGFALATGALNPVEAGTDRTSERILGGLMIVLGGVYAMIAWRREQYRLLLWVPFASQAAIVVPLLLAFPDGAPLLVVSGVFLALMVYVWWQARDWEEPEPFEDEYEDEYEDEGEDLDAIGGELPPAPAASRRGPPASDQARRARNFRRRDT
jgi:hypothetical protein